MKIPYSPAASPGQNAMPSTAMPPTALESSVFTALSMQLPFYLDSWTYQQCINMTSSLILNISLLSVTNHLCVVPSKIRGFKQ